MSFKFTAAAAAITLFGFICACSPQASGPSSGAQVATAGSGQKCEVDAKKICQGLRNKPVIDAQTGLTYDSTEIEQNQARTTREFTSLQVPNGSMIEVSCEMNANHQSVVYAHLMPSPPLTATDVAYLENTGYCVH